MQVAADGDGLPVKRRGVNGPGALLDEEGEGGVQPSGIRKGILQKVGAGGPGGVKAVGGIQHFAAAYGLAYLLGIGAEAHHRHDMGKLRHRVNGIVGQLLRAGKDKEGAVLLALQQRKQPDGQLRRQQQIGVDAQLFALLDEGGIGVLVGGKAILPDDKGKAPRDIAVAFGFQPADMPGACGKAIVPEIHTEAQEMVGIDVQGHIVDDAVVGAAFILQGLLRQLQDMLLLAPSGKVEPHIHQAAQAALRVVFDGGQLLPHHGLDEGAGDGIHGTVLHGEPPLSHIVFY